jgi:beta-glucosidase
MRPTIKYQRFVFFFLIILIGCKSEIKIEETKKFSPPVSYEEAGKWADSIVAQMTLNEKITLIGGNHIYFTNAIPRLNIPSVMMADATQGIHLRDSFQDYKYEQVLPQSTAFPCPILLASTWNVNLAEEYARSIGEECKAGGIAVLLGPGMNIYRISQCGRNFEYFGEDPYLSGHIIENYIIGLQNTGTIATLKHFVANNSDYFRRKSNSVVDERALQEIYTPAFKAGIDAGAMAVMTSYNLLNGEWCGQSEYVINNLLRRQLGFKWLVMTDWWSVYDGEKVIASGQDLEMPYRIATENADELVGKGIVEETSIDSMVTHILRTFYAMRSFERKPDKELLKKFKEHEKIALQTAREGIVLLRNENNILPIETPAKKILLTGEYIDTIAYGGGAAEVNGYNRVTLAQSLKREFGENLKVIKEASDEEIRLADVVILSIGTNDSEGRDRPFNLPPEMENRILHIADINSNIVIVVSSGSGINMTRWFDKVGAILYAWYGGQTGAVAVAEIIAGKVNPSGKLPITIEKDFKDSPGYDYIPKGEQLYTGWNGDVEKISPVYNVHYDEGIFVGYRWYEKKNIEPLFPFGYGLSYTNFTYSNLQVSDDKFVGDDIIDVSFMVTNSGNRSGSEIAQLYIQDFESKLPRPVKELKGFNKVSLKPGETRQINLSLTKKDFSYWDPDIKDWYAEPGEFKILIGSSSSEIHLRAEIELQ